jgi:predicted acylesterase/phospholipase RssA
LDGVSVRPIEARQIDSSPKKADFVFEGGGVKGVALVGALSLLVEHGYDVQSLAGASAGAVVAVLYASDNSAEEAHTLNRRPELWRIPGLSLDRPCTSCRHFPSVSSVSSVISSSTVAACCSVASDKS